MTVPQHGQIVLTTSPQALSATQVSGETFTIKAPVTNVGSAYLGASTVSTTTGYQLDPGESVDYQRNDQHGQGRLQLRVNDFYVLGTAGDTLTWLASQ